MHELHASEPSRYSVEPHPFVSIVPAPYVLLQKIEFAQKKNIYKKSFSQQFCEIYFLIVC